MDALSHALIAAILFSIPGLAPLIPFAILGAVIPDVDILFPGISDPEPSLYLFSHGGITHSVTGAIALSVLAYLAILLVAAAGFIPGAVVAGAGMYGFAAILAGSLLHLAIDLPACPGIPLLAPFIDRKYTLGILPGPSILLACVAVGAVASTLLQLMSFSSALMLYGGSVIAYLAVRTGFFLYADIRLPGLKIPGINPFRWLVIREDESEFRISSYTLLKGYGTETVFRKFQDTDAQEIESIARFPEVRRFLFHAYCIIAERIGSVIILADPVREKGYVWYPPKFKRVAVAAADQVRSPG